MDNWVGKSLSKVRIERLIGRGGMADVYLGRHLTLDRPMAIKILHAHTSDDPDLNRRFKEEAQAVAAMRHPNIVQVVDFDVFEDRPYIVMELLQGMSLASYLSGLHAMGHSLAFETIGRLISGIASALDYAHGRQIVHRDVKPANIVLRKGETPLRPEIPLGLEVEPILTDFGVARIASSSTRTASGTVLGTPAYMSPEQVMGQVVDARSDIYSLGIILYEMLAGQLPFNADTDTPASILYKHVHEPPPHVPDLPGNMQSVVEKALAKDKGSRYQRAGDLAEELVAAASAPTQATRVTPTGMPAIPAGQVATTPEPAAASFAQPPATPPQTPPSLAGAPTVARSSGLSGVALVGAFGLGAAVLAGGVFLGVTILRGIMGEPAATEQPQPTAPIAAALPTEPATLAPTATAPSLTPTPLPAAGSDDPVGSVLLRDNSLTASIQEVPNPAEGMAYHAWVLGQGGAPELHLNSLGEVQLAEGRLILSYASSGTDELLLGVYDTLIITLDEESSAELNLEQAVFRAELDPEVAARLTQALEVNRGAPLLQNLTSWVDRQSVHFASHAGFAEESLQANSLAGGQLHAEHTINITVGAQDDLYQDWNQDGSAQDPSGDSVGLLNYLRLLQSAAEGFSAAQALAGRVDELPDRIAQQVADLIGRALDVRDAAREIAGSDEIAVVRELSLAAELTDAQAIRAELQGLLSEANTLDLAVKLDIFAAK